MAQYMSTSFFGVETATYLCDRDGNVLAKSSMNDEIDYSVLDSKLSDSLKGITPEELARSLALSSSFNFSYNAASGEGSVYVAQLGLVGLDDPAYLPRIRHGKNGVFS